MQAAVPSQQSWPERARDWAVLAAVGGTSRASAGVALRIGRRQQGEFAPHLCEQLLLGLLQLLDLAMRLLVGVARFRQRRRRQRRSGTAGRSVAAAQSRHSMKNRSI